MGRTIVRGDFEWDEEKAKLNFKKHGISFEDAVKVFADHDFLEFRDDEHSTQYEERIKGIGIMRDFVIVVTIFTERTRTRLISARLADKDEEELYYERRFNYD